jgi:hypothetical protein
VAFHVDIEAEHLENDIYHVVETYIDAIEAAKEVAGDLLAGHVLQLVIVSLQSLDEESGRFRLKPIVLELFAVKRTQEAEKVVTPNAVLVEMIPVVSLFQPFIAGVFVNAVGLGYLIAIFA